MCDYALLDMQGFMHADIVSVQVNSQQGDLLGGRRGELLRHPPHAVATDTAVLGEAVAEFQWKHHFISLYS